jgi:hypothetical protein
MAPNPIDNPTFYTDIKIGGRLVPGSLKDVRGLKSAEEWLLQKGIGATGASTIWRGRPPIQGIEIEIALNGTTPAETRIIFDLYYAYIKFLKPKKTAKPPAYVVRNTSFQAVFIDQVVYAGHTSPVFTVDAPMTSIITINEFAKPIPILPAVPEAALLNSDTPAPKSVAEAKFAAALARAGMGPGASS